MLVLGAAVLLAGVEIARAQSASAGMAISVTVVRPCTITLPAAGPDGRVEPASVSCGRGRVPLPKAPGILPVAGAAAPVVVTSSSAGGRGRTVTINF